MKEVLGNGCNKLVGVVQEVSDKVGNAAKEEFDSLKNVLDSDSSTIEKLYAGVTFLDPQAWAEKHPEVVKPVTVTVLGAIGAAYPVMIPVATFVGIMPENICSSLMDLGNRLCPPYLLRYFLKKKIKNGSNEDKIFFLEPESGIDDMDIIIAKAV